MASDRNQHPRASRREFLGVAGASLLATGASLTLGSAALAQGERNEGDKMPEKKDVKVRLAVVGGGFGASHHWHEHPNCEVTAVTDLVEDRRNNLMKQYNCNNVFPSLEVMLEKAADQFDAVAVFTDAPSHAKHAIMCMDLGKHVVSACPVAMTLEDIEKLKKKKEATGLKYMLHESSYYRQECIAAREAFQAGEFGRLAYSEVEYYHPGIGTRTNSLSRWQKENSWRWGLTPLFYPTHSLGLIVGVTRERIVKVSAFGQCIGSDFPAGKENRYNNPFDNEMALGITNQGNICRFGVFWQIAAHGERGQWLGEKMSCYMPHTGGQTRGMFKHDGGNMPWEVPDYWAMDRLPKSMQHDSGHGGSSVFLCNEFIMALIEDREPVIDIYESIAMNAPGIVGHESALQGGKELEVPNFDPA